jgi:hypothetical protein
MAGGSVSLLSSTASATTTSTTLTMTSGTFGAHGNTPTALPTPATFSGKVSTTTGNITAGTLTIPSWKESNTGSTETIHIFNVSSGTATGSVSYNGNVTIDDTVTIQVKITSPISATCNATPVHLVLQSTSPYNKTTKDVDLSDTTYSIPDFTTSCGLARGSLDTRFSGSSGNVLTLDLHGTLTEPPAPATSTTTSLSASPASPQLQGTTVTLTGTVKKTTGATATAATGTIDFYSGTTEVGAATVSSGVASAKTKTLPSGTDSLKAVYSGNSSYNGSTSSSQNYTVSPKPTVTSTLPVTAIRGTATATTFNVKVTNPSGGEAWTHLKLGIKLREITAQTPANLTMTYENGTHVWCAVSLSGFGTIEGTFKGLTGACGSASNFSLAAGHSLTIPFRIKFATKANVGTQTTIFALETVNSTGAVVAPFTTATRTAKPVNAPYATGFIHVDPTTKYTVTVAASPPSTAIPLGYVFAPSATITTPPNTTGHTIDYPFPTGTVRYLVTGHTFTPPIVITLRVATYTLGTTHLPTKGLSVGTHTLKVEYSGDGVYNAAHVTATFKVGAATSGTAFTCSDFLYHSIDASVAASATLPATTYTGSASATSLKITLHVDPTVGPTTSTAVSTVLIGFTPGGGTTAGSTTPTESGGVTTLAWTGLSATITGITGTVGTEVPVGITTIDFVQSGVAYSCTKTTTAAKLGTVKVVAPPTPVTWSVAGCTTGSTTAPAWANTEKVVAKGAGGGGGGAAASATGYGGAGGAGGSVTTTFTITGSSTVSAKTGCAGKGAPQGSGVVGNGGASVSGWSASGAGGQGRYTAIGITHGNDGTGGSGGGSTGVCNGASTCTSSTTTHAVAVASGGGGGGESMCSGTDAGNGGQAGNAGTTATSSSKGKGLSGTGGATGGTGGVAGGAGGANNKSSGSGSAAGSTGGEGKEPVAGDGGGSGGGGAGYIGGAGGAPTADDCGAGGGGGGGASWVATAGGSTTFGTGSSGGSRSGTTGTAGAVTVTFSFTKTR